MRRSGWKYEGYLIAVVLLGMFALCGCPKKTEVSSTPEPQQQAVPAQPEKITTAETTTAETKPAEQKSEAAAIPEEHREAAPTAVAGLKPVYFDFDKSSILAEAGEIMKANAEWLKANPRVKIKIAGNCDERGTKEYNQALGQRRAASAKRFLTDLGIAESRISLISYGKEMPGCSESSETCWEKNRRDDFTIAVD